MFYCIIIYNTYGNCWSCPPRPGAKTIFRQKFNDNDKKFIRNENLDGSFKKVIRGKNIKRYNNLISDEYIDYQKGDLLRARDERIFLSKENKNLKVMPGFRPDNVVNISNLNYVNYIESLGKISNIEINSYKLLLESLENRIDFW